MSNTLTSPQLRVTEEDIIQFFYREYQKYIPQETAQKLCTLTNEFVQLLSDHSIVQAMTIGCTDPREKTWGMLIGYAGFIAKIFTFKIETSEPPHGHRHAFW